MQKSNEKNPCYGEVEKAINKIFSPVCRRKFSYIRFGEFGSKNRNYGMGPAGTVHVCVCHASEKEKI